MVVPKQPAEPLAADDLAGGERQDAWLVGRRVRQRHVADALVWALEIIMVVHELAEQVRTVQKRCPRAGLPRQVINEP